MIKAIMYSKLRFPRQTAVTRPAPPVVKQIEVRAGNLGTLLHYSLRIPVRIIRRKRIEVKDGTDATD